MFRRGILMAKKIYVGNLPFTCRDQELSDIFADFGSVDSAKVIMDRDSGRSKGFGFVEMSDDDAAMKAIDSLNGKEVGGRALNVSEAKPQEKREGGGGGFRGGRDGGGGGGFRGGRDGGGGGFRGGRDGGDRGGRGGGDRGGNRY
jgi:RNA recognition motif-containing protein